MHGVLFAIGVLPVQFKNFQVMVDYAHNTAGFQALGKFLEKIEAQPKIGIIAGVGDRRDEDIFNLGKQAAHMFDKTLESVA
jgi:cyanophycin synthetase